MLMWKGEEDDRGKAWEVLKIHHGATSQTGMSDIQLAPSIQAESCGV
jgi:hypothetical protein